MDFLDLWEIPPEIDVSMQRLAKQVLLVFDDTVAFRDPMDRKIDSNLKRIFAGAGLVCKPAVTLTAVTRVWAHSTEAAL